MYENSVGVSCIECRLVVSSIKIIFAKDVFNPSILVMNRFDNERIDSEKLQLPFLFCLCSKHSIESLFTIRQWSVPYSRRFSGSIFEMGQNEIVVVVFIEVTNGKV